MLPSGDFALDRLDEELLGRPNVPELDRLEEPERVGIPEEEDLPVVTCSKAFKGDAACDLSLSNLGAGIAGGEK